MPRAVLSTKTDGFGDKKAQKTKSECLPHCCIVLTRNTPEFKHIRSKIMPNISSGFYYYVLIFSLSLFVHNYVNCFPIVNQNKPFQKSNKQNKALLPLALALESNAKLKIHSKMEQSSKCVFVLLFRFHLDE